MRAPRYRFPEEVRETTRTIASRMVQQGSIARTPEELDGWISGAPDVRESLQRGGYGTAFTSADLLPLVHVFVGQAGGAVPQPDAPPPPRNRGARTALIVAALVAVAAAVALLALG